MTRYEKIELVAKLLHKSGVETHRMSSEHFAHLPAPEPWAKLSLVNMMKYRLAAAAVVDLLAILNGETT